MIKPKKNLTGQHFGKWTVIKQVEDYINSSGRHYTQWLCECSCDKKTRALVLGQSLTGGNSRSCGCLQRECAIASGKAKKKYNAYDLTGEYGIGYASKGEKFYFDLDKYDLIKDYRWYFNPQGYVVAYDFNKGKNKYIRLHRLVMDCYDNNLEVDHIHGIETRFDNRKSNLRIVTHQQNIMNCKISKNNTSGITGVCWCKQKNKWEANIVVNGERLTKHFDKFNDAILQRMKWENEYFGEFSYSNSQLV